MSCSSCFVRLHARLVGVLEAPAFPVGFRSILIFEIHFLGKILRVGISVLAA